MLPEGGVGQVTQIGERLLRAADLLIEREGSCEYFVLNLGEIVRKINEKMTNSLSLWSHSYRWGHT